jgi:hypothetical protein
VSLTITPRLMRSTHTAHTARPCGAGWTVSWLPGRVLTRSQAVAAMNIAEAAGAIPASAGPEVLTDAFWLQVDGLAAGLGLSGPAAVVRASEPPAASS